MNSLAFIAFIAVSAKPAPIDFDTDVLPILTKAGCNAAACHGAAAGRGGFKLSLFGGDPAHDYDEIVHRLEGRRINLARPDESLLLLKPTGEREHEGDVRLQPDSDDARLVKTWIRQGARRRDVRELLSLRVEPNDVVVASVPGKVNLQVRATFDDGTKRDVTRQTVFWPADPAAVEADYAGQLKVLRKGRHTVVVRYLSKVKTVAVTVPLADEPINLANEPRRNWIDDEILGALETLRILPSAQADDATILRRVRLDLTGRLPTPDEVRAYIADRDEKKYEKLVDRLLGASDFTEYWTFKFAKLLRIRSQPNESQAALAFHNWVRDQIKDSTPLNEVAVSLLTAEGDTHSVGPANFYRVGSGPREQAEYVSEVLMGVRLRCANCHNHPLDQWTQDDYHGLSAVFARIDRGRVIRVSSRGEVTHPRTGQAAVPRIPGDRFLKRDEDARRILADWLTKPDNPYFARSMVNRNWKALMGRGLIEPTDDLRATNPATHPKLIERLTRNFIDHNYDLRNTIRLIATSAAYARSGRASKENRADDRFYSHALQRSLEAEVMADAIADVTGVANRYGGQKPGTRAIALFDSRTPSTALDILGRCSREDSCETTGSAASGITTKLHLINGELINAKITSENGRLHRLIASGITNEQLVGEFYLRALGRLPNEREQKFWKQELDSETARERWEDFVWSLLCSREFATNH